MTVFVGDELMNSNRVLRLFVWVYSMYLILIFGAQIIKKEKLKASGKVHTKVVNG